MRKTQLSQQHFSHFITRYQHECALHRSSSSPASSSGAQPCSAGDSSFPVSSQDLAQGGPFRFLMSKINNLEFAALNLSGDNYLQWVLDTKILLRSKNLGDTITEDTEPSVKNKYQAIVIIRHHLAEGLKDQYLTIEDPLELWTELKNRYDHQKTVILPKALYDWRNLRIQDYKSVEEYNSVMFKIVSKLKLCGETNNELLMMNSELRPPGTKALPEAHAAIEPKDETPRESYRGRMRGRGRWQGSNRGFQPRGRGFQPRGRGFQPRDHLGHSRGRGYSRGHHASRGYKSDFKTHGSTKTPCYRCGMTNHWANRCRTPQHLVKLYQESIKGKDPVANWVHHDDENDLDHENDQADYETSDLLKSG
ncbi:uncharacterized protein LOC130508504 [Raphanus sativus]|uniref:Uncharacterized protein LOC130508504 n=1 Tax=Raphanus sativus TaxID=3726 RepID=A0A9W3D8F4_RAPSA|nr:uncharacterized protein LOC130508504 [Raphanus sativus]